MTVTNLATNIARTTQTDAEGNYVITPLDPGNYRVSAETRLSDCRARTDGSPSARRPVSS